MDRTVTQWILKIFPTPSLSISAPWSTFQLGACLERGGWVFILFFFFHSRTSKWIEMRAGFDSPFFWCVGIHCFLFLFVEVEVEGILTWFWCSVMLQWEYSSEETTNRSGKEWVMLCFFFERMRLGVWVWIGLGNWWVEMVYGGK